jgi:hypothetical protein
MLSLSLTLSRLFFPGTPRACEDTLKYCDGIHCLESPSRHSCPETCTFNWWERKNIKGKKMTQTWKTLANEKFGPPFLKALTHHQTSQNMLRCMLGSSMRWHNLLAIITHKIPQHIFPLSTSSSCVTWDKSLLDQFLLRTSQ